VVYHLGWKYALDLELPYEGFHPTVLVYFRDRLEENKAERVIFDGVVELLIELGLVKRRGKQRIDSTHILGYVKEMSRLECAVETVRLALEELAGVVVRKRPEFWERLWALYVQSEVGWRLSKSNVTAVTASAVKTSKSFLSGLTRMIPSSVRLNRYNSCAGCLRNSSR